MPLALGTGPGFEIRQPLGYAIIGGLMVSGVLHHARHPFLHGLVPQAAGAQGGEAQDTLAADLR